ncbi:MAG: SUMF1/EgtB/PvdO family nonheme iron enzyme [Polyangiaceae bacterium]
MRRSRALVVFGGFLTVTAVGTVSAHSRAAGRSGQSDLRRVVVSFPGVAAPGLELLAAGATTRHEEAPPFLANDGTATLFGSFVRPVASPKATPSDDECPPDMVAVEGDYCPFVAQTCLRWLDPETMLQCAQFDRTAAAGRCPVPTRHKHFCVDRYEWPNKVGVLPQYMASWTEASASCESIGKRLCSDTEWTLACEGPERKPYPYGDGYVRDDRACNIDKPYIWPHPDKLFAAKTRGEELARLDQREPSGSRDTCVSPYGVRDMVGNVDEWVVNESQAGKPFRSGLKGGYWGPVRTRCRPMTTAHDENFRYYQIGFRCCEAPHLVEPGEMPIVER